MRRAISLEKAQVRIQLMICFLMSWLSGAGSPVWLDQSKTSIFDFYQFFVRVPDAAVGSLLRQFTFLPEQEVAALEEKQRHSPEDRPAQTALAQQVGNCHQKLLAGHEDKKYCDHFHSEFFTLRISKSIRILFQGYTPCAWGGRSSDS